MKTFCFSFRGMGKAGNALCILAGRDGLAEPWEGCSPLPGLRPHSSPRSASLHQYLKWEFLTYNQF